MRPTPIPLNEVWPGGRRVVYSPPDGNLTRTDIVPVEAVVDCGPATGAHRISVRCIPEDDDLDQLAAGGTLWVAFYGALVPFCLEVKPPFHNGSPRHHGDFPGWEGSIGPFPRQYGQPHVYARDVHSGAGNCVCGAGPGDRRHVQIAPGVPVPTRMRT